MRRTLLSLALIVTLLLSSNPSAAWWFGWTLSASSTDPFVNAAMPAVGMVSIFVWYWITCTPEGLASAEFDIVGTLQPISFTPRNGFVNAGGASNLLLSVGGCPAGPLVAGELDYLDGPGTGFNACFAPSAASGVNISVNCVALGECENGYVGYASDGTMPCYVPFCPNPVANHSWAGIKSLYR